MLENPVPKRLMEDHRDAYFFWEELELREQICLHIDAHLDVSDLKTPGCEVARSPEINCGNYLLPAMRDGLVSELVWVIPDHLPGELELLAWTRLELQNWLHLELDEYMGLTEEGGRVHGLLCGKPFTVCFSRDIPHFEEPVLLDIDVDYYLSPEDGVWQSPGELVECLQGVEVSALTVAYSLQGGYTPARWRFLGPLTELCLRDREEGERLWQALRSEDGSWGEEALDWIRAAQLYRSGDLEQAYSLDSGYRVQPIDEVSAALMRGKFEEASQHLKGVVNPTEAQFMEGMIAFRERQFESASQIWLSMLEEEPLEPRTLLYLLTLCSRALLECKRYPKAREILEQGRKLARKDSEVTYLAARAALGMKLKQEAAKLYRRAIKLAPSRLETAELKLELAELYLELGQMGLADHLLHQIVKGGTPGFMKLRAEALNLKLALGMRV